MDRNEIIAVVEEDSKDRVNKIPDCILSYILSSLRIKDAVDTCLISRGWRDLWKGPRPNLEFDIPNIFGSKYARLIEKHEEKDRLPFLVDRFDRQCFVRRVNKLLELYSGNKVESLRVAFFFDVESTAILDKWIRFAIAKGAKVLDLHLLNSTHWDYAEFYVFPHWIFSELNNAAALKHLSLHRCVLKPPTDFNRLAQLTALCLNKVFVDPGFLEHLFSICVLLEGLTLIKCRVRLSNLIIGPSCHLRDLKVLECDELLKIEIDAVNLSFFEYDGIIFDISCMKTPQLVRFFFRGFSGIHGLPYAFTLLALCPSLETLHLQSFTELENIPETLPTFSKLKHVSLDLFNSDFDLGSVVSFLKAAPLLEELVLTTRAYSYQGEIGNLSGFSHNHLRKVKMQGFQGKRLEIELAICILKFATKLEVMVIDTLGKHYHGCGRWTNYDCSYYQEGNEDENEDVDSEEGREDENKNEEGTQHENEEDNEVEEGSEHENKNEDENEDDDEGVEARELSKDEDEDKDEDKPWIFHWERRGRAVVQQKLKEVKTDAQVIIL
ncbi:putative F-box domain, FBD domain, leucine-rich repeat domain, L domain-containing protein [Rosa chinensis]|uniref:Putative F-box domain, FBD domain, leucine-rich repeat domain, L domain-containing protein n=1 Tax=Rosa chinensis TaxID=74649 RepID=A0A2P6S4I1_ROSCH|nr:FBD-associated F-box protein At4g13985 [Rosa chinensis]PRQ53593.1 putative F-box domain, FBD domain, leucine-rich repeat domain, L domain-containing protein [Rosa chinensis]